MSALDTNVLVRLLVEDDPRQLSIARRYVESEAASEAFLVPLTVALELEWVLRSRYDLGKDEIIALFERLLETSELSFERESVVETALRAYDDGSADFADCLHLASAASYDRTPLATFDRKASRMPGVRLLR